MYPGYLSNMMPLGGGGAGYFPVALTRALSLHLFSPGGGCLGGRGGGGVTLAGDQYTHERFSLGWVLGGKGGGGSSDT